MARETDHKCLECGGPRDFRNDDFCGTACKARWHNRAAKRGKLVYHALMASMADPEGKYSAGFRDRVELALTTWLEADKKEGRRRHARAADTTYKLPLKDRVKDFDVA